MLELAEFRVLGDLIHTINLVREYRIKDFSFFYLLLATHVPSSKKIEEIDSKWGTILCRALLKKSSQRQPSTALLNSITFMCCSYKFDILTNGILKTYPPCR